MFYMVTGALFNKQVSNLLYKYYRVVQKKKRKN